MHTNHIKSITHILEIENEHYKHLDLHQAINKYLAMQKLQFNPVFLASTAQNMVLEQQELSTKSWVQFKGVTISTK